MLGVLALQTRRFDQAVELISQALARVPDDPQALANMASACSYLGRTEEAIGYLEQAVRANPRFAGAFNNLANIQQNLGRHADAAASFERLLALESGFDFAVGGGFQSRRHSCDWADFERLGAQVTDAVRAGRRADRPFSFLSVSDSGPQQLQCARTYASFLCPAASEPLWRGKRYGHSRIRIAYVSADFRDHIVSHVMAGIYENHDKDRFETFGIALLPSDGSEIAMRAQQAMSQFLDASQLSDEVIARRLREFEIDIAIDLTGFTQGCRLGLWARRPAPAQVNFMGHPGTLGVPYLDYLIADDFVVPAENEGDYSERLVRMPDCFQANDERHSVLGRLPLPQRRDQGLPEDVTVLCSFNNSYKLNPACFDIWMRVMSLEPRTVLWLLGSGGDVEGNLRREAASRGIAAERLVFARRVPYHEHLSRLRLADLYLDTLPFNGGATAADVLWAGVPLLTQAGEAFAARMGGSLLRAAGLPELITYSPVEYEARALELVRDPSRLLAVKRRLADNQRTQPLFDTQTYCRHLETAYTEIRTRTERGEPPANINVPRKRRD
jgi:protein O-GlcNAc transferase